MQALTFWPLSLGPTMIGFAALPSGDSPKAWPQASVMQSGLQKILYLALMLQKN
jgi:hypothetical protein